MDTIIVICIIIAAVVYTVMTFYKSQKKENLDGCGCGTHKGGCTGCGGARHRQSTGADASPSKNSKDAKVNIQVKRKQLKPSIF